MKVPEKVRLSFDPETSTLNLKNPVYAALWGCIKVGHITDQYFTGHVEDVVEQIEKKEVDTYEKFMKIIRLSGLKHFGLKHGGSNFYRMQAEEQDPEFWGGVWEYVSGKRKLKLEYSPT